IEVRIHPIRFTVFDKAVKHLELSGGGGSPDAAAFSRTSAIPIAVSINAQVTDDTAFGSGADHVDKLTLVHVSKLYDAVPSASKKDLISSQAQRTRNFKGAFWDKDIAVSGYC